MPVVKELVLGKDDGAPGWTVNGMISDLNKAISKAQGRSLIIRHYAGHAAISDCELICSSSSSARRFFSYDRTLANFKYTDDERLKNTDVALNT